MEMPPQRPRETWQYANQTQNLNHKRPWRGMIPTMPDVGNSDSCFDLEYSDEYFGAKVSAMQRLLCQPLVFWFIIPAEAGMTGDPDFTL